MIWKLDTQPDWMRRSGQKTSANARICERGSLLPKSDGYSLAKKLRVVLASVLTSASVHFSCATDYYVDAESGNDTNNGKSLGAAFQSIARVNSQDYEPGDNIYIKRGQIWRETLVVSSSGMAGRPITFTGYGTGANPQLICSDEFADWTPEIANSSVKVWKGLLSSRTGSSFGAMRNGQRVNQYLTHSRNPPSTWLPPEKIEEMANGFFYAPISSGTFFFRWDAGHPGPIEVGARKYAVLVTNCSDIIISGIDLRGPAGDGFGAGPETYGQLCILKSRRVLVANASLTFHSSGGISLGLNHHAELSSSECTLQNLDIYGHQGFGIYATMAGESNRVERCSIRDTGSVRTDWGDMCAIGVWRTPKMLIEGCIVANNGYSGMTSRVDAAVSFVQSPGGTVKRCLIRDCAATALQFAESSDGGLAAYNIIDGWGKLNIPGQTHNEGIRIGGGMASTTAKDCKVYNNLFIHGPVGRPDSAALKIMRQENTGFRCFNNVFYQNSDNMELCADSTSGFRDWELACNCYFRSSGTPVKFGNSIYKCSDLIGVSAGFYSFDVGQEHGSICENPKFLGAFADIAGDSPCVGKGRNVGLSRDFYERSVPGDGPVTIGPFQASDLRIGPPSSLRVVGAQSR